MPLHGKKPSELLQAILDTADSSYHEQQMFDKADAYREGDQLTEEIIERRTQLGLPNPQVTLVTEAINSVLGQEIKRRTDTQVVANTEADNDVADAIDFLLRQQEQVTNVHEIDSTVYDGIVVPGIGWTYVGKSDNPMQRGIQVINVDRDDVIFDRRGVRADGSDCQWRAWRRFMTPDAAKMILPKHAGLIDAVHANGARQTPFTQSGYVNTHLEHHDRHFYRYHNKNAEIALYCVWYRDYKKRTLMIDGDNVEIYNPDNIRHVSNLEDMDVYFEESHVPIMREAWFVGQFLASDEDSPHPHNEFPLIEGRGYIKRKTRRRYGLLEHAYGPQDEYNLICTKIAEIMVSKRIFYEEGIFGVGPQALTAQKLRDEIARRDTVIGVQPGKLDRIRVEQDWAELSNLINLRDTAREQVRIAMGVNFSMTGEIEGQHSGTAIASLAELSMATMGKLNSNYEFYRKQRAWLMVAHIIDEIGEKEHVVEVKDESGKAIKQVTLNQHGDQGITNRLSLTKLRVQLRHISTSQGHKAFNHQRLVEMHNSSDDPELRKALVPAIIKQSDVPDADEILESYLKSIGQSDDPEAQAAAQKRQEIEDQMIQLEMDEKQAEIDLKKAQAEKARADARAPKGPAESPDKRQDMLRQLRQVTAANQLSQPRTLQ